MRSVEGVRGVHRSQHIRMEELLQKYGLWALFFGTMIEGDLTLLFVYLYLHSHFHSVQQPFQITFIRLWNAPLPTMSCDMIPKLRYTA